MKEKIFIHLPAYREPELIPTIESALDNARFPERLVFGICRQYNPDDGFDNLDRYENNPQFKIYHLHYEKAKGLAYARAIINEELLEEEEFVLQLDSHHRFTKHFDVKLIKWYNTLKSEGNNPLICGYLPYYDPYNDPEKRVKVPWWSEAASFYPHGTIFIRPTAFKVDWKELKKPVPARFISGHFCFGPNKWAKDIKHDTDIYFAGEELNLTIRSFTHGYDLFHPHEVIIWHATMREERSGILVWDDQHKRGDDQWHKGNDIARSRIRQLLDVEDNGHNLGDYNLGTKRTLHDYEVYSGINFKNRSFQQHTIDNNFPSNPKDSPWKNSYYHLVNITHDMLPGKEYDHILVSFDDIEGKGIHQTYITDDRLVQFIQGSNIHYEEMFYTTSTPVKIVYWGYSKSQGWAERIEFNF